MMFMNQNLRPWRKCADARGETFREVGVCDARRIMLAMVRSTVPPAPTHTRRLRRLPHTLLIIQHTISLFRTRYFALVVLVSFGSTPAATTTGRTGNSPGFGVAQEWWEWRRWLHWWAGVELPATVPSDPSVVRDATSSYLI
jgi:hypothetical protein